MPLTYSLPLMQPDDNIDATVLSTLFTNIREAMSQITGTDIIANADIPGSAIATGSLPGDRIASRTVTTDRIALQAVTNAEVLDATLQKGKLSTTAGQRASLAQLEVLVQTASFSGSGSGTIFATPGTAIPTATYQIISVRFSNAPTHSTNGALTLFTSPSGGNYLFGITHAYGSGSSSFSGNIEIVYIAKT